MFLREHKKFVIWFITVAVIYYIFLAMYPMAHHENKAGQEGYTDEDLAAMAEHYYSIHSKDEYAPPIIDIDYETEDGEVTIHLYEMVDTGEEEGHIATYARYVVDRATAKGYDGLTFEEIDLTEKELKENVTAQRETVQEDTAETDSLKLEQALTDWARAFAERDGNAIAALSSEELKKDLLSGVEGQYSFGVSSPWPWDGEKDALVYDWDEKKAEIYYYAWVSDPHVTVWKETLTFEWIDESYVFTEEQLICYEHIASGEEYVQAYPEGQIEGTRMDYLSNGSAKALNDNALLSSSSVYQKLLEPESAAVELLNLLDNPNKVQIRRLSGHPENGKIGLEISFMEDGTSFRITMVQPYGEPGIWVPQDYREI